MTVAAKVEKAPGLAPFSLTDAPSYIEHQFPVSRLSIEAYKERSAVQGQTLTTLGTYWKGRKPLILVRAVVLGGLLPASNDPAADLDIFLKLMAMDDAAFARRFDGSAAKFAKLFPSYAELVTEEKGRRRIWRADLSEADRQARVAEAFATLPYSDRVSHVRRPEEIDQEELLGPIWIDVNNRLGTNANSIGELIEQLGIARFGHRPKVADTFCGGGSIPFEAARMGCDVYASDLNPIACMLTWGSFNIIGASKEKRAKIEEAQREVAAAVDAEITKLGIEHDKDGNRAKAYLYCLETRCPKTGWMVPMLPTRVISKTRNVIATLVPDHENKRYLIEVHSGVSDEALKDAENGTIQNARLVHPINNERSGVELKTIRGDYRDGEGNNRNRLRLWEKSDFVPRPDDVFQERLYCIQWISKGTLASGRQETFFAPVTDEDVEREREVESIVEKNLARWQQEGLVPDMPIEHGDETTRLYRERGWTHWHHLFCARNLLFYSILRDTIRERDGIGAIAPLLGFAKALDWGNKLCYYGTGAARESISHVFANQALNTLLNYGIRGARGLLEHINLAFVPSPELRTNTTIQTGSAVEFSQSTDIAITDPPYADAINYHEITEFFIAWLRKNPPASFDQWTWGSRRDLAIKGRDEQFRKDMVAAYSAITRQLPENGLQVVMFTHQDPEVWADLGSILWASGLRVSGAWNIVTEKEKPSGDGNYVQGTINLVLRKRHGEANARRMEIEEEIEDAVRDQLERLAELDEAWAGERLYTDGDLTLAAYAAALKVVTSYSTIDRQPLDRDLYRKLPKGERTALRELIDYAEGVANNLLVPEGLTKDMWRDLNKAERFYVRMLDMEAKGATKVADFQNFAKSFAFGDYAELMASTAANAASLAGAADLKGKNLRGDGFADSQLRQVLFAVWKAMEKDDPKTGVTTLKTEYTADYWQRRQKLIVLAEYISAKTKKTRPDESAAAHELAEALKVDRV